MRTESYEIVIPEKARVMTEEEMEYEGGFLNFLVAGVVSLACSAVSIGCSVLASVDPDNAKIYNAVGGAASVVGAVAGFASGVGFLAAGMKGAEKGLVGTVVKAVVKDASKATNTANNLYKVTTAWNVTGGAAYRLSSGACRLAR